MLSHRSTFAAAAFALVLPLLTGCATSADPTPAPNEARASLAFAADSAKCSGGRGEEHVRALVRVDRNEGTHRSRSGVHQYVQATFLRLDEGGSLVDRDDVELVMNVASARDGAGLPSALPLRAGDELDVDGIYVSSSASYDGVPVIHFTHAPCGSVTWDGDTYE